MTSSIFTVAGNCVVKQVEELVDPVVGRLVSELVAALEARVLTELEELVDSVDGLVELTTTPA